MRRLPAAILVSVASHAAALGWIVGNGEVLAVPLRDRATDAAPASIAPPTPPDPEPIAIALLEAHDEPPSTQPRAGDAAPVSGGRRGGPAISTGATGPAGPQQPQGSPGRSPWMTMRGGERARLGGLSSELLEHFLENSKPVPPPPDIPGERIGEELAEARRQLRHAEHIGSSRVGELRDKVVALAAERDAEELKPAGGGTYRSDHDTFTARVDADGQTHLEDKNLDTQDRMMLWMGIDPYARNKLAFLDRTRDQRAAVGARYRRVQLAHSAELMQRNIDRLWATATTIADRKLGLFALWDDCAETGSDELIAGGAAARSLVLGVIRARLVGDSAFTADEIAQLNARRQSKAVFAPYE
jgi:hypothetical protein